MIELLSIVGVYVIALSVSIGSRFASLVRMIIAFIWSNFNSVKIQKYFLSFKSNNKFCMWFSVELTNYENYCSVFDKLQKFYAERMPIFNFIAKCFSCVSLGMLHVYFIASSNVLSESVNYHTISGKAQLKHEPNRLAQELPLSLILILILILLLNYRPYPLRLS